MDDTFLTWGRDVTGDLAAAEGPTTRGRHGRWCFDVIDGPYGDDAMLRPNQVFAVSLAHSPLTPSQRRAVVDACARHLVTSYGLRSVAPCDPRYVGHYGGDARARDGRYRQGAVGRGSSAPSRWRTSTCTATRRALSFLAPLAEHLGDHGLGSIAEIFDGAPPVRPNGCMAQAWSVGETLRAWQTLAASGASSPSGRVS